MSQADSDGDGMHDNWELSNGLDANDKTDAFCDYDDDKVINLFEFQMETDPYQYGSPKIVEVTSDTSSEYVLNLLLESAENPVVIRMAEGEYLGEDWGFEFGRLSPVTEEICDRFRFQFQGGWAADFSEQDPFKYHTTIRKDGNSDRKFFEIRSEERYLVIAREAYIFDGLIIHDKEISINRRKPHQHYLSVFNCSFQAEEFGNFIQPIELRGTYSSEMFARIVNTTILDAFSPIRFFNESNEFKAHLSNVTITNLFSDSNTDSNGVLIGASENYSIDLSVENSIIWALKGFSISELNTSPIEPYVNLNAENSVLSTFEIEVDSIGENWKVDTSMIFRKKEPIYSSKVRPHYTIADGSPFKATATPNGSPYLGAAPDLGVNTFAYSSSLVDDIITIQPNCGNSDGSFELNLKETDKGFQFSLDNINFQSESTFENLPEGEYIVYIRTEDNCGHFQQVVVLECQEPSALSNIRVEGLDVYPNPVSDIVSIKVEKHEGLHLKIESIQGVQCLELYNLKNGYTQLNLSDFAQGMYFIKLIETRTNSFIDQKRIIKI